MAEIKICDFCNGNGCKECDYTGDIYSFIRVDNNTINYKKLPAYAHYPSPEFLLRDSVYVGIYQGLEEDKLVEGKVVAIKIVYDIEISNQIISSVPETVVVINTSRGKNERS